MMRRFVSQLLCCLILLQSTGVGVAFGVTPKKTVVTQNEVEAFLAGDAELPKTRFDRGTLALRSAGIFLERAARPLIGQVQAGWRWLATMATSSEGKQLAAPPEEEETAKISPMLTDAVAPDPKRRLNPSDFGLPSRPPEIPRRLIHVGAPGSVPGAAAVIPPFLTKTTDVPLLPGFNLSSIPNEPPQADPVAVLAPIMGQFSAVYAYDACDAADPWKVFDPADPAGGNLLAIDHKIGFWIDSDQATVLPSPGTQPAVTEIQLCTGWNLIGYPLAQPRPVRSALASIEGRFLRVFGFDLSDPVDPWEIFDVAVPDWANDLQLMQPGRGYWVLATEDTTLQYTNQGSAPVVEILSPADGASVTSISDVLGTVRSNLLDSWTLSARRTGDGASFAQIASGNVPVEADLLGRLDPTMWINGIYELRLEARDFAGQVVSASIDVVVEGQLKIGNFTLPLLDVELPVAGLPIQVVRTYDSRDKRLGDFGVGWRLSLSDVQLQENGPPGLGWRATTSGGPFPTYCILPTRAHIVTIVFPDGEVFRFQPRISPECQALVPQQVVDIEYVPLPGTQGELLPIDLNPNGLLVVGSFPGQIELWDQFTVAVHDAEVYQLTTTDGRVFVIEQRDGLQSITDLNGNVVTFSASGIEHSSGLGVDFERDLLGRITAVVDPRGGRLTYEYDAAGDLVRFNDQENLSTEYRYIADHFLQTIVEPNGREILAAEYDGDGRLIRACDGANSCNRLAHDLGSGTETLFDGSGRATSFTYDNIGNLLSATDALGNTTLAEYDALGNQTKLIDPLGNETEYTYDGRGNLLSIIRPHAAGAPVADFTTRHVYNSRDQLTRVILPSGGEVHAEYDSRGNLEAIRDENGGFMLGFGYDASGNVTSESDPFGTLSYSDLEPTGEPRRIVDQLGEVTTVGYDAMGEVTSIQNDNFTASFDYDAKGRSTRDDFGNGLEANRVYGSNDDWLELTGPTYGRVSRQLTASNRLAGWEVDGLGKIDYVYDASGRPFSQTDPEGNVVRYNYDVAGRLDKVVDANGGERRLVRDAAGRVIEAIDALGHSARTTYFPDGRPETFTDPNNHTWSFSYTPTSTTVTDPLNRTETLLFSPHGLHTATLHADGSRSDAGYLLSSPLIDADEYPTSFTDEGGHVRAIGYDAIGQLTSATDLGGTAFTYEYADANLSRVVGPTGEMVAFTYDARDNIATLAFPDGGVERRDYDVANRPARITRPSSTVIDMTYDAGGRLASRSSSADSAPTTFSWNKNSQISSTTDGHGVTAYQYDALTNLEEIAYPDGSLARYTRDLLGRVIAVELRSDSAGPIFRTEYAYDPTGNLVTVRDPLNGVTTLAYDAVNRVTSRTLPNGVVSEFTYNDRDQITSVVHRAADTSVLASATWERSGVGEPSRVVSEDGSFVELDYDSALRLIEERYFDATSTLVETISYTYDASGNRLTLDDASGSATYSYGAGDRLLSVSGSAGAQTFAYDADGRVASIARDSETLTLGYDSADQLLSVTDTAGPIATYTYDAVGRRVESGGSTERSFVVAPAMGGGLESTQMVTDGGGQLLAGYVYAGELPLMRFGPDGPIYYLTDPMGSVMSLADGSGAAVAQFRYDAFGRVRQASGPAAAAPAGAGGDFRFHGGWLEETTGLYHFRARDYDPRVGRFLTRDSAEPNLIVPESMHPYRFANANPFVFRDPTGQFSIMSVNISMSIQGIVHSIKLGALQQIRRYLIDKVGEAVTDLLVQAMFKIMFASVGSINPFSKGIEAWQAGMKFQEILTDQICNILGPAGSSVIWFDTPIDPGNGKPRDNGFQCGSDKKGISADLGDKKPDFLLKQGEPKNTNKKAFLIGDFKISVKTFYGAYITKGYNKGQWKAMYRHAQNHQFLPRAVLFIAFHKGKRYHWKELAQLAIAQRVGLIIFSFK